MASASRSSCEHLRCGWRHRACPRLGNCGGRHVRHARHSCPIAGKHDAANHTEDARMMTVTPTPSTLNGHRATTLGRSPFAATAPSIIAAIGYAIAAMIWVAAGATLPGGRWLAVHLFTLGVVTNLVLVFSDHFGRTVTRSAAPPVRWQPVVVNAGIVLVLVGITTATTEAVVMPTRTSTMPALTTTGCQRTGGAALRVTVRPK